MSLPVLAITAATLYALPRFCRRHPMTTLITFAGSFPFEYRTAFAELAGEEGTFREFAESWLATMASLAIQLPLLLIAIRETATLRATRLDLRGMPSRATWRYGACSALVVTASMVIDLIDLTALGAALVKFSLALLWIWFVLRSTLTFTALALGRSDLGFALSIGRLSGQTLRLFGISTSVVAAIWIPAAAAGLLAMPFIDIGNARLSATAVATIGFVVNLAIVIAGAHLYRAVEGGQLQNGKY